nr:hypothetical protein [Opitutales bacterium]
LLDLHPLAQQIGMDCPFFLHQQSVQLATGRGELLEPIAIARLLKDYHCLVFCPSFEIHTPDIYRLFKENPHYSTQQTALLKNTLLSPQKDFDIEALCFNSFEFLVLNIYPELNTLFTALREHDFRPHLTGSGSGGFILGKNLLELQKAQKFIWDQWPDCRLCEIVTFDVADQPSKNFT